jgi:hypothetical protein
VPNYKSEYFDHPVKKFIPFLKAEGKVRQALTRTRNYSYKLVEHMLLLAAMGLIQIGKRLTNQSDTVRTETSLLLLCSDN